jgi:hypothetical protein
MAESDNILTKLQDLLVCLIPQLNKFPREQKFVLGDRIETKLLDVQADCLRAYYSRDKRGHLLERFSAAAMSHARLRCSLAFSRVRGRACASFSGSIRMSAIADKSATTSEAAQSS